MSAGDLAMDMKTVIGLGFLMVILLLGGEKFLESFKDGSPIQIQWPSGIKASKEPKETEIQAHTPNAINYSEGMKFFNGDGSPVVWYYRDGNGEIHLFDAPGHETYTGEMLLPIRKRVIRELEGCYDSIYKGLNKDGIATYEIAPRKCSDHELDEAEKPSQ
jgi:hypothetical protein